MYIEPYIFKIVSFCNYDMLFNTNLYYLSTIIWLFCNLDYKFKPKIGQHSLRCLVKIASSSTNGLTIYVEKQPVAWLGKSGVLVLERQDTHYEVNWPP